MPVMDFIPENKVGKRASYPRLKLTKDQKLRILCLEASPTSEFVHTLRMPTIDDETGRPVYHTRKAKKKGDPDTEEMDMTFVGRPLCSGDFKLMRAKGTDTKNCKVCAAAADNDAIAPAEQRFSLNIGIYSTVHDTWDVIEPFSMRIVAWTFGGNVYDVLVDLAGEWGDLRQRDLMLGPCTVELFQKFEIKIAAQAQWLTSDERKKYVAQLYQNSKCQDLTSLIGWPQNPKFLDDDLVKIRTAAKVAFNPDAGEVVTEALDDNGDMTTQDVANAMDLSNLLGGTDEPRQPKAPDTTAEDALAAVKESDEVVQEEREMAMATSASPSVTADLDLDELLG